MIGAVAVNTRMRAAFVGIDVAQSSLVAIKASASKKVIVVDAFAVFQTRI